MLKLSQSLLFAAMCTLFFLGAVIEQWADDSVKPSPQQQQLLTKVLASVSLQANRQSAVTLSDFISAQQQYWQLTIQLLPRNSLALPAELETQLYATDGLVLPGDTGTSYLKALPAHPDWLLQLHIADERANQPGDLWLIMALYVGLSLMMLLCLTPMTRRSKLLNQTAGKFSDGV
jgi:hypothetical protein